MKKYIQPTILVVRLQHQGLLMQQSGIRGMSSNLSDDDAIGYGGGGSGEVRTKESSGVWDEEW